MELPKRSPEELRMMIAASQASLFHWLQRDDHTPTNLSIGLWQLSRVYCIIDSPQEAMRYAKDCLEVSQSNNLAPFCLAYAHEAMSRAAMTANEPQLAQSHLAQASKHAADVTDEHDKKLIDADLEELAQLLG